MITRLNLQRNRVCLKLNDDGVSTTENNESSTLEEGGQEEENDQEQTASQKQNSSKKNKKGSVVEGMKIATKAIIMVMAEVVVGARWKWRST